MGTNRQQPHKHKQSYTRLLFSTIIVPMFQCSVRVMLLWTYSREHWQEITSSIQQFAQFRKQHPLFIRTRWRTLLGLFQFLITNSVNLTQPENSMYLEAKNDFLVVLFICTSQESRWPLSLLPFSEKNESCWFLWKKFSKIYQCKSGTNNYN